MNNEKDMSQGYDAAAAGGVTPVNNTPSFFRRHKWLVAGTCAAVVVVVGFLIFKGRGADKHECVDLGLSVKWATCNVGASSPYEYGDYFAWGETAPKSEYTNENCKTLELHIDDISGILEYDAARANWGGEWRMPTAAEMRELVNNCTFKWEDRCKCYKVTSKINGNSIFLPVAGRRGALPNGSAGVSGYYWSSTAEYGLMPCGIYLSLNSNYIDDYCARMEAIYRGNVGFSVRPVMD